MYDGLLFDVCARSYSSNGTTVANVTITNTNFRREIVATNLGTRSIDMTGTGTTENAPACNKCTKGKYLDGPIKVTRASGKTRTMTAFTSAITGNLACTACASMVDYPTSTLLSTVNTSTNAASLSGKSAVTNGLKQSVKVDRSLTAYNPGVLALNPNRLNFSAAPEPAAITLLIAGLTGLTIARHRHARMRGGITAVQAMHTL